MTSPCSRVYWGSRYVRVGFRRPSPSRSRRPADRIRRLEHDARKEHERTGRLDTRVESRVVGRSLGQLSGALQRASDRDGCSRAFAREREL